MKVSGMKNKKGQIVIVLLLTMLVALAIGLTITQRSITDIATSTQTEQSSRAFSAAEAGIEKALKAGDLPLNIPSFDLGNQSKAEVKVADSLPRPKQALEFPPIGKDQVAQFWLANINQPFAPYYTQNKVDVYFGNVPASSSVPAAEINLIYRDSAGIYKSVKKFVDPDSSRSGNGFSRCEAPDAIPNPAPINTTSSLNTTDASRSFLCKYNFDFSAQSPLTPMIIKVRILYADDSQRVAVQPIIPGVGCTTDPFSDCSLPPQATIYTSTGTAGQSQKTLQVYKAKMIPLFFDYAIFATGEIKK